MHADSRDRRPRNLGKCWRVSSYQLGGLIYLSLSPIDPSPHAPSRPISYSFALLLNAIQVRMDTCFILRFCCEAKQLVTRVIDRARLPLTRVDWNERGHWAYRFALAMEFMIMIRVTVDYLSLVSHSQ